MATISIDRNLELFLRRRRILGIFKRNAKEAIAMGYPANIVLKNIENGFILSQTREGFHFWYGITHEYKAFNEELI